ncbi:MAG: adenylate kinase [Bdellovibrionaceae bacterium]|nr:adenylate kinase [Pseudobdellovibrionaceae bacterium]
MNIVLFGAPGAGKGTQSTLLVERLGYHQISTGDLFRHAIKNKTELGRQAQGFMDRGELVPDSIVIGMVDEVLENLKDHHFILDGFPRTRAQAEALGKILQSRGLRLEKAIFLEVPKEELLQRLTGRRVCQSCGAVYHIQSKPTRKDGICDLCGGAVIQRNDDKEDVIATRLRTYEENTFPLRGYYKEMGNYAEVDGSRPTEAVFESLKSLLKA